MWKRHRAAAWTRLLKSPWPAAALLPLPQRRKQNPEAFVFDPASNLLEALSGPDAEQALDRGSLPPPASPNARRPMQSPGNQLLNQLDTFRKKSSIISIGY